MDELVDWAKSHGAAFHPSVEVYNDPNTGNSFRVSPESAGVSPGDTVVTCPLALTLSYLNATTTPNPGFHHNNNHEAFPSSFLASVPPHVISRFFLIRQYLLGKDSFWYPYIRTLPQPANLAHWALPPLWPSDDVELLEDTNAHVAIAEIKARLRSEHKHALAAFGDNPARHDYTRLLYNWAYCIFTSRSFRPSLVIPAARQHTLSLPEGCAVDDFSLLLPLFDVGNHSPTARVAWATSSTSDAAGEDIVGLRTLDPYAPGAQVFNNYGTTKTNAELMLAYGFRIPESEGVHNDYVHVQKRGGAKAAAEAAGADGAGAAGNKPKDYLISLRPVADPSSVAARSVRLLSDVRGDEILPPFRHVQDSMVWELVLAQTTAEQRSEMLPVPEGGGGGVVDDDDDDNDGSRADLERLRMILTGRIPAATQPLLFQTIGIIQNKVLQELERLDQSEFEMDESEATRNQLMAYHYRRQCRKVLENVLESMEMPDEVTA
ncbi:SET domain-containing protein [Colletotrichum orchidophilum]|uniref:SET domain-containing protein n=1 Tax=Colletotrichum orchidophilum TaxID=1209926 RepID=A0A1G4B0W5_9PEZI|nr:SET domain-containing protein [Colletotrichum orchidophilum]OHE94975.1 SET domain-containing protein [Colletotrichum orchidophilum]